MVTGSKTPRNAQTANTYNNNNNSPGSNPEIGAQNLEFMVDKYNDLRIMEHIRAGGRERPTPPGENWGTWQRMGNTNPEMHHLFDMSQLPYCESFDYDADNISLRDEQETLEVDSDAETVTAGDMERTPRVGGDGFDAPFGRDDDEHSEGSVLLENQMVREVRMPAFMLDPSEMAWRKDVIGKYEAAKGFDEADDDEFFPAGDPNYKPKPKAAESNQPVGSKPSTPLGNIHRQAVTSAMRINPAFGAEHRTPGKTFDQPAPGSWLGNNNQTTPSNWHPAPGSWSRMQTPSINVTQHGSVPGTTGARRTTNINARAPTFTPASQRTTPFFEGLDATSFPGFSLPTTEQPLRRNLQQLLGEPSYLQGALNRTVETQGPSLRTQSRFFPGSSQPEGYSIQQTTTNAQAPGSQQHSISFYAQNDGAHDQSSSNSSRPASSHSSSSSSYRTRSGTNEFFFGRLRHNAGSGSDVASNYSSSTGFAPSSASGRGVCSIRGLGFGSAADMAATTSTAGDGGSSLSTTGQNYEIFQTAVQHQQPGTSFQRRFNLGEGEDQ